MSGRTWPTRDEFLRMTPAEVNEWLASMGFEVRVADPETPCPECGHPERLHGATGTPPQGCWAAECGTRSKGRTGTKCHRGRPFAVGRAVSELDEAWAAVEAALPEGDYRTIVLSGYRCSPAGCGLDYHAHLEGPNGEVLEATTSSGSPTPVAALRDLAVRLHPADKEAETSHE